jgi:hypothetical protein
MRPQFKDLELSPLLTLLMFLSHPHLQHGGIDTPCRTSEVKKNLV